MIRAMMLERPGEVRRPLRSILTQIYLCDVCSCQEILRRNATTRLAAVGGLGLAPAPTTTARRRRRGLAPAQRTCATTR
jgi:hypothetical protein